MGHDDSDKCVIEITDDPRNEMKKHVYIATYGLLGVIALTPGGRYLHWQPDAALLTTRHAYQAAEYLREYVNQLNILHKITQRLTR